MACCALISQCISRHYPCCRRCLPRTLIIIILAWPLPLEFLQSNFGGSSHNRTAGCGQQRVAQRVWETLSSCEAEHMLCSCSPSFYSLLVLMACTACTINRHGRRHLQFLCIFAVRRSRAAPAIRQSSPSLSPSSLCQYLSQSHFAACCSIANNIN